MIQRPKGTRDLLPEDTYKWQELESNLEDVLEMILIVSKVEVKVGDRHVEVTKAPGTKCERCSRRGEDKNIRPRFVWYSVL